MTVFIWSIFVRAVIDHMIFYNSNWPEIKLGVHYFVFSCALDHILIEKVEVYILTFYKIRYILEEIYVAVS